MANKNAGVVLNPASSRDISATRRILFRNPERAGQIFLRLAGRADWLYGFLQNLRDKRGDTTSFDEYWKKDSDAVSCTTLSAKTSISTACSGLPCWKAATCKPTQPVRSRLRDGERREDV